MTENAYLAFIIALVFVGAVGVPFSMWLAPRLGVLSFPGGRHIHEAAMPAMGGVAIVGGVVLAVVARIDVTNRYGAILLGTVAIMVVGLADDRFDIAPALKLGGQVGASLLPIWAGVTIDHLTVPFLTSLDLGYAAIPITVVFIVACANIVNFSDGMDGLAGGLCAIAAATFAVLSLSFLGGSSPRAIERALERGPSAVIAAAVAGACIGFLIWNFHPAMTFMGDSGSLPLGFLLATTSIQGVLKTSAALTVVFPFLILAVPILDTSFVILKRLKYGRPIASADANHLHHRLLRIGYSQRQAALLLYAWCGVLSAFSLTVRFLPPNPKGSWDATNTAIDAAVALAALAASLFVVYQLEILKYRHVRMLGLARRATAESSEPLVAARRRRRAEAKSRAVA